MVCVPARGREQHMPTAQRPRPGRASTPLPPAPCHSPCPGASTALPWHVGRDGDAPEAFGSFLQTSQHVRSFQTLHQALHPVLPAPTAKRALWGVWHQAWLSCMERSLGETTHSCRSSLSLLLRSSRVKEAKVPACRNCSPLCWVLAFKQELSSGL